MKKSPGSSARRRTKLGHCVLKQSSGCERGCAMSHQTTNPWQRSETAEVSAKRNLLRDLHELADIEPGADATHRAMQRVQFALNDRHFDQSVVTPSSLGARLMRPRNLAAVACGILIAVIVPQLLPTHPS